MTDGLIKGLNVAPGHAAKLARRSTDGLDEDWFGAGARSARADAAREHLEMHKTDLARAQELLWATATSSVLVVLQAMDAAGKDGTISHVMSGVNPQGCAVTAFKQPSAEELAHDFLWRCARALPERGKIAIFNRSYYEDVLVSRVHPDLLSPRERSPIGEVEAGLWSQRFESINEFERHLVRNGTVLVKVFLHVSREEQRRRLLERLENPAKQWKFSPDDLSEAAHFGDYMEAYEAMLTATSTSWAPWFVVPADHKPTMRALTAHLIVRAIDGLDLRQPQPSADQLAAIARARQSLQGFAER